jgi:hypothetical protein
MATSGSFGMSGSGYGSTFNWWLNSQSIPNNISNVGWNWTADWSSSSYVISSQAALWVNGSEVFRNAYNTGRKMYGGQQGSGSLNIGHDSDGGKIFGASGEAAFYQYAFNAWGSGSWALPNIPRAASITSATNFNDETNPVLGYSNPAGNSVTTLQCGIWKTDGSTALTGGYRDISKTGSSYTIVLSDSDKAAICAAFPNQTSATVRYYLRTVIGGVDSRPYVERTVSIVNANPTFTNFAYKDTNATVTAITGNNQVLVQNQSVLQATISVANKMVAQKSATPSTYSFQFGSVNISANYSASAGVVANLGTPAVADTQRLTVKAFDSRANSATAYKDIIVVPYAAPVIDASVKREGGFEDQTTLSIAGAFSLVQVGGATKNAVNTSSGVKYRFKQSSMSTWGNWTNVAATITGDKISTSDILMNCDNDAQWDFEISITDKFGTTTVPLTLSVGIPILHVSKNKRVGVNKVAEQGDLDVAGDIYSNGQKVGGCPHPVGTIIMSAVSDNPSTVWSGTTWVACAQGRSIVGVDPNDADFNAAEKTGGSKTVTLSVAQLAAHNHTFGTFSKIGSTSGGSGISVISDWGDNPIGTTGSGQAHPNMQPYSTAYVWKRTT